jgi:hypothetical protein
MWQFFTQFPILPNWQRQALIKISNLKQLPLDDKVSASLEGRVPLVF